MTVNRLPGLLAAVLLACVGAVSAGAQALSLAPLTVFAAADLGPPLKQIAPQFERQTGASVTIVLGSTGMLAQQIRNGAPADVFFAANESFVTDLAAENLTLPASHTLYARGRIALVTLKSSGIRIADLTDLANSRVRRIAIANPQHAPYGLAARQALEAAGLWKTVETKLVFGENVQQAVQFVRSGSAQAGLVARSVVDTPDLQWTLVDDHLHAPLNQMAAVTARTKQPGLSRSFIEFVNGASGRSVMRLFGFLLPGETF
jgi:molybdate transport system substrate-binding protein